jgi:hypothetical protein
MDRHRAVAILLESRIELGKNTAKRAGMQINVYAKGSPKRKGPQLGTIFIGQGSFVWHGESGKKLTLNWTKFAEQMEEIVAKRH